MPSPRSLAAHLTAVALLAAFAASPRTALASAREGSWSVELTDEWGRTLPTFEHRGRTYVLGEKGLRYLVRVHNGSDRRVEVVVSVDGRDVTDGRPASTDRRGYLVEPWGDATIDGYRLSQASVAAFRFGSVARSYAAATGDARDVGVIGVAVFPERVVVRPPPPPYRPYPYPYPPTPYPYPYPYLNPYGAPEDEGGRPEKRSESAPPPSSAPSAGEAAPSAKGPSGPRSAQRDFDASRPGLGTEFGEAHGSPVYEVAFERASSRPAAVLTLRYDDRRGLIAAGVELDRWAWDRGDERWLRERAEPFRSDGSYAMPPPGWRSW
jgi:hypothetical protein